MWWIIIIVIVIAGFIYKSYRKNTIPFSPFEQKEVIGSIHQLLETTYLIYHSNNPDTVKERLMFLWTPLFKLQNYEALPYYESLVKLGVEEYLAKYPGRKPSEEDAYLLLHPTEFTEKNNDNKQFWAVSMYNSYLRHAEVEIKALNSLKTNRGKLNRLNKLLTKYNEFVSDFRTSFYNDEVDESITELGIEIETEIKKYS